MLKELQSSPRKLANVFRIGRAAWKARAQAQQKRAKALAGKVRDLTASRDGWKAKAKALEEQLRQRHPTAQTHGSVPAEPGPAAGLPIVRGAAAPPFCPLPNAKASASA